jgi:hypothetical protein
LPRSALHRSGARTSQYHFTVRSEGGDDSSALQTNGDSEHDDPGGQGAVM